MPLAQDNSSMPSATRYKSLTLILQSEDGSTRIKLDDPSRDLMLADSIIAPLVRLHESTMGEPAATELPSCKTPSEEI
jgi:hypothetical protein